MEMPADDAIRGLPALSFGAGEVIIAEGRKPEALYFLANGAVEILKGETQVARESKSGSIFGEMSILLGTDATASVRTTEPSVFFVARDAARFLDSHPELSLHLAKTLAARLEAVTRYLADVKMQFNGQSDHLGMVDGVLETLLARNPRKVERGNRGH